MAFSFIFILKAKFMKTVFVILDSLNRGAMEPYGSEFVQTPNFSRFQKKAITFDNHYVGSLHACSQGHAYWTKPFFAQKLGAT